MKKTISTLIAIAACSVAAGTALAGGAQSLTIVNKAKGTSYMAINGVCTATQSLLGNKAYTKAGMTNKYNSSIVGLLCPSSTGCYVQLYWDTATAPTQGSLHCDTNHADGAPVKIDWNNANPNKRVPIPANGKLVNYATTTDGSTTTVTITNKTVSL